MKRLLLLVPTGSFRTEAFVDAAKRAERGAGDGGDEIRLAVASEQTSTMEARFPDRFLTLDFAHPERAAETARIFALAHGGVHAVVGVDETTVRAAAQIGRLLGLPGNAPEAVAAASNKRVSRERLRAAGVRVPEFRAFEANRDPDAAAREISDSPVSYPCVLKPLILSGSRGVIRADDPASFATAFRRIRALLDGPEFSDRTADERGILVEAFAPGVEVALEGILRGGRLHVLALFDKPDPLDGPLFEETLYVTPSRLPGEIRDAIVETTAASARALGLVSGPVHAELRVDDQTGARRPGPPASRSVDGRQSLPSDLSAVARDRALRSRRMPDPVFLEIAARSIGGKCSRMLRFGTGATLEDLIVRDALGLEIDSLELAHGAAGAMMLPIPGAGVLRAVSGLEAARAVPGIESVEIVARPGERLVPLPEGGKYPGFLFARGPNPESVENTLRVACALIRFRLDELAPPIGERA